MLIKNKFSDFLDYPLYFIYKLNCVCKYKMYIFFNLLYDMTREEYNIQTKIYNVQLTFHKSIYL